jgi:hypothetical protein
MYPNREMEQHRVVVNTPGERRETVTAKTETGPHEVSMSPGTIATIALLAALAIGIAVYIVSSKNANEAANRQAMIEAAQVNKEQPAPPPAVVPAPAQQPVIIQQPAPPAQAPVIVQQPSQPSNTVADDMTIQELATKRLTDDASLAPVSVLVINGRATLNGTVDSTELKTRAETVVKGVRGVKSVENKIVVLNP